MLEPRSVGNIRPEAETRRLAVVVGNNEGSGARPSLRYAEEDAVGMAQVLGELGGIEPANMFLLRGSSLASIQDVMQTVERRVKDFGTATWASPVGDGLKGQSQPQPHAP